MAKQQYKDNKKNLTDVDPMLYGKVQPQAIELEEAVLGAVMMDKDAMSLVSEILRPDTFYVQAHSEIYAVMESLYNFQKPIDILTVREALIKAQKIEDIGGISYLVQLTEKIASAANVEYHARILTQKYIQRELIRISTDTIRDSFEDAKDVLELMDEAESKLFDITDKNLNTGFQKVSILAPQVLDEIDEISKKEDGLTGVTTGFDGLDKLTNGWQQSDLIILAARPGMGKTAFTLSLAKNAAEDGQGVAVFSLEMSGKQLTSRLIAMESELDSGKLRSGKLEDQDWPVLQQAVEKLSDLPIFIDDTPSINIFELRAKVRRLKQKHNIQLVVIDYLQLMSAGPSNKNGNREQEISMISRALKGLAKEMSVPVIALSQLSRAVESRSGDKRPMLSDLRESGAIEQDADIVTFIYRPSYYGFTEDDPAGNLAEIIVAKHRNGALETVKLSFIPDFVKFVEYQGGFNTFGDIVTDPFAESESQALSFMKASSKINEDQSMDLDF